MSIKIIIMSNKEKLNLESMKKYIIGNIIYMALALATETLFQYIFKHGCIIQKFEMLNTFALLLLGF